MKIGVLGSGDVARTLASGFLKHGHDVILGSRTPDKLQDWAAANSKGKTGTFAAAAAFGEMIVLAVKGSAASEALRLAGEKNLAGKVVIDACNPIADVPPVNGVLSFFTPANESLLEQLQREFQPLTWSKGSPVGANFMSIRSSKAANPPCSSAATMPGQKLTGILDQFGWETVTWAQSKPRALLSLCVYCGASLVFCVMSGHTHLSF